MRKFLIGCSVIFAVHFGALLAAFAYAPQAPEPHGVAAMVVLGGGKTEDGLGLGPGTVARLEAAMQHWHAWGRPLPFVVTGGGEPAVAQLMAETAQAGGIPPAVLRVEDQSLSTLQNALYSKAHLDPNAPVVLVTNPAHMLRARASFWAMGYEETRALTTAQRPRLGFVLREVVASWANLVRLPIWRGLKAVGLRADWVLA